MWSTLDASTPQAYYASANGGAEHTRVATTTTYTAADLCGEPATTLGWRSPGQQPCLNSPCASACGVARVLKAGCACYHMHAQACCTPRPWGR